MPNAALRMRPLHASESDNAAGLTFCSIVASARIGVVLVAQ